MAAAMNQIGLGEARGGQEHNAAESHHRPEGGDEGRDSDLGGDDAIDEPDCDAGGYADQKCKERVHAGCLREPGHDERRKGECRADGKVELTGDDQHCHPDGNKAQLGHGLQHHEEVFL